jgi:mono/diheme cytochrome c family protein
MRHLAQHIGSFAREDNMARVLSAAFTVVCLAMPSQTALAQSGPPDAQNGLVLAERLCATCHAVAPEAAVGRPDVPGFAVIAKAPNTTPERLAGAIILPHPAMPGVPLTRAELRDVIAYIMSLKPKT